MPDDVVPTSTDREGAARLARAAVLARPGTGGDRERFADQLESEVRSGDSSGVVRRIDGRPVGLALWSVHGPLGMALHLIYLEPSYASEEAYRRFWSEAAARAGPIAFARGEIAGLTAQEEDRLLRGLGFAPYGRLLLRWREGTEALALAVPAGGRFRPVGPPDAEPLVRLHARAYRGTFDRLIFLEDADDERDAARLMADLFRGRWGPFAPEGSVGLEVGGTLVGAVLSAREPDGLLIADVIVDPAHRGKGYGRAVLAEALRSIRAAGAGPVYLAVTESNDVARRLYASLGFELSQGPSREWYDPKSVERLR